MQRVIDQLSETKDPKLFNRKINKLLDLFDKWEQNLLEREQHLLKNSKKLKNIHSECGSTKKSNDEKEIKIIELQRSIEDRERNIEERERILFSEKQELENNLTSIKTRERTLHQEKEQIAQKENQISQRNSEKENQMNLKVKAITSRINEKENILIEKKNNQIKRQDKCMQNQVLLSDEKEKVMKQWDEVISSAQSIKDVEQENKKMLLKLRDIHQNIEVQNSILDKKYESLHHMHGYQQYKQQIDEREQKLKFQEDNVKNLQRELVALRQLLSNSSQSSIEQKGQNSYQNRSLSPAQQSDTTQASHRQSSLHKQNNLQISVHSHLSNSGGETQKLTLKDCNIPKPNILINSSSTSSISSNNVLKKAGSTSKIKQKFSIKNIKTDDSQIFSPISKHNPMLSSCSGISPLNQNREDEMIGGMAQHQTHKTINSGQNLCTINDTKSDQTSKAPINFDSTNYEYNRMQEKRRLFADQISDPSELHVVEEKSYNQLSSICTDSHQNSIQLPISHREEVYHKYSIATNQHSFFHHNTKKHNKFSKNNKEIDHSSYQSVVRNQNDRDYYQNLMSNKQKLLEKYEEPNIESDQQEEDSINMTHTLNASPSKVRISYNYSNEKDY